MDLDEVAKGTTNEVHTLLNKVIAAYHEQGETVPDFMDITIQHNTLDGQVAVKISIGDIHLKQ